MRQRVISACDWVVAGRTQSDGAETQPPSQRRERARHRQRLALTGWKQVDKILYYYM